MNLASIVSINSIPVRLTDERWEHIVLLHPNLSQKQGRILATVQNPDSVLKGSAGELLALSKVSKRRYIVVIYKETQNDGFIITAYETTDTKWLFKKKSIWNKRS